MEYIFVYTIAPQGVFMTVEEKMFENKIRRSLYRIGYQLQKQRGSEHYMIADTKSGVIVAGLQKDLPWQLSLDEVLEWLKTNGGELK